MENTVLVKEFEAREHGQGNITLVSRPVPIQWKTLKCDLTHGLLDLAVTHHAAEEDWNQRNGSEISDGRRGLLPEHDKLAKELNQRDKMSENSSFFTWFGYRGAIVPSPNHGEAEMADF